MVFALPVFSPHCCKTLKLLYIRCHITATYCTVNTPAVGRSPEFVREYVLKKKSHEVKKKNQIHWKTVVKVWLFKKIKIFNMLIRRSTSKANAKLFICKSFLQKRPASPSVGKTASRSLPLQFQVPTHVEKSKGVNTYAKHNTYLVAMSRSKPMNCASPPSGRMIEAPP